ncbi:AI-2E family transporter [Sporosarcina sp. P37]|uniref:AI-2E family transporter n=1 Tax=unclassified Sporosarcina TaxID=2647733 RepID=UPI0009BD4379|nr:MULTISPECIES: AI-2E family transporter [unclassified Sporosarcina]ARD48539.1 AI-2E family transporter [Sporosarcina sp. P33]ARK25045.1 AI-2E family transporter [Sporosarcina sp. P37]PID18191.1 AI-2E family transporter [Sporosarcina sp. P35]
MTKKVWFQTGIGILLALLITKYFLEVNYIFRPVGVILQTIILPLIFGGLLFYMTVPIQKFLEKKGLPRWGSIITVILILVAVVWILIAIIGPIISKEVNNLVDNGPALTKQLEQLKNEALNQKDNLPDGLQDSLNSAFESVQTFAVKFGKWFVQFVQSFVQAVVLLLLVPFFFFFMLKDHEKFAPKIYNLFSGKRRLWIKKTLEDIDQVLRSYIQGQLLISAILASIILIGYWIIGLEYALLLAILALFMNLIPFIGPWIAVAPALLIGYLQDPKLVIWVGVVTLVAQQIDSNLITPNVMGKSLDIHPLTVITVLLVAGSLAGFLGILVAVPAYAVGKVIVQNIYEMRREIQRAATKEV